MMKNTFMLLLLLIFAGFASAQVNMLYPVDASLASGATVQVGSVFPGQEFELIFSDNSGNSFEWDTLEIDKSSFPSSWSILGIERTASSLVARIKVPRAAQLNVYNINVSLSSSSEPSIVESINARVVVKEGLLAVTFARKSEAVSVVGQDIEYTLTLSNSSIGNHSVVVSSTLPSNWFSDKEILVKPNSVEEITLKVNPKIYGQRAFVFTVASVEKNLVVSTFNSDLKVRPTLKGKFAAPLSGMPFFSFALIPFGLVNSYLSLVLPA